MKKLDTKVNIIPIIAKADTISKTELQKFKVSVIKNHRHKPVWYFFVFKFIVLCNTTYAVCLRYYFADPGLNQGVVSWRRKSYVTVYLKYLLTFVNCFRLFLKSFNCVLCVRAAWCSYKVSVKCKANVKCHVFILFCNPLS
jgi:hypothetical protein